METFNYDDLERLPLNEEEPQLCQILYSEEYKNVMGLLRALMEREEYSARSLALTERAIGLNAAHYTVWTYRYNIAKHLNKNMIEELDWSEGIALSNPKNYQIWPYRQLIIESEPNFVPEREFPIIQALLEEDTKNHHVWSYRKWLVEKFNLFNQRELEFTEFFLNADIRNNSAWSHRFFISFGKSILKKSEPPAEILEREINFAKLAIQNAPQNPSAWNYIIGIYNLVNMKFDDLEEFCKRFSNYEADEEIEPVIESIYALEILAQIYRPKNPKKATEIYDLLEVKYDPIRANYWRYEKSKIKV